MSDPTLKATVCPQCGAPAAAGEGFCRNCGKQLYAPTITAPPPAVPGFQSPAYSPPSTIVRPVKKRRSKFMMGCLIFIGLIVVALGAGGIYVWRRTAYTPPVRTAPEIPQRAAGSMTEFPVDNDPNAPAKPSSVQTEALGGATAKASSSSTAKLPPGIDKTKLSKGATTMTSATYKPKPKTPSSTATASTKDQVYICVLVAMPGQTGFVDDLASSVVQATSGQISGVKVQSPKGGVYNGSKIKSSQGNIYVLGKEGGDIVILIFGADASSQSLVDRLAQNIGNGEGLNDYPEIKETLWTLPANTPSDLTLQEISMATRDQIESSMTGSDYDKGSNTPVARGTWTSLGTTDCNGKDVGQSIGSALPEASKCDTQGLVAICWDGDQYRHPGRAGAWCTYKNTGGAPCHGGSNAGLAYECRDVTRSTIATQPSSGGGGPELPSELRAFIPERMTTARYTDSAQKEWTALNLEYGSSFQAWRTWLLARGALGLSGAQTTTVREVDALYLDQDGKRIMVFQKGPYLILLSGPSGASADRFVALGNQIQV